MGFFAVHCNGNSTYVFLFWELHGLSPNFHIHVSVSDLYIPKIDPHISSSRKDRPIVGIYNSLTDTWMYKLGLRPQYSFSGNICFKFLAFCLCSVGWRAGTTTLSRDRIFRPSSREKKAQKARVSLCACFRENWFYKFGHPESTISPSHRL